VVASGPMEAIMIQIIGEQITFDAGW